MGVYKWYMIWSLTNMMFFLLLIATYEVEPFTVYPIVLTRGVVQYFNLPLLSPLLQTLSFSLFDMHTIITLCRFVYRYAQSTENRPVYTVMSTKKFFAFLWILYCGILLATVYLRRDILKNGIDFQRQFPAEYQAQQVYFTSHVVTASVGVSINNFFEFLVYPTTLLLGSWCTYKCYSFQNKTKSKLGERTRYLYRLLIYGLIIEQIGELTCFIIPFALVGLVVPVSKQNIGYYIVHRIFYIYPTFVMVFTLVFYRRYRHGVKATLARLRYYKMAASVSVSHAIRSSTVASTSVATH